jgi:hypothetical protein
VPDGVDPNIDRGNPRSSKSSNAGFQTPPGLSVVFTRGNPRSSESAIRNPKDFKRIPDPFIRIPLRGIPDPPPGLSVIPVFIPSFITGIID